MEQDAALFSARILELLDGKTPILGVVQKVADTPLTNAIRRHPDVRVLEITTGNREEMAKTVLQLVKKALDRVTDSGGGRTRC